jgi:hypothetical protein
MFLLAAIFLTSAFGSDGGTSVYPAGVETILPGMMPPPASTEEISSMARRNAESSQAASEIATRSGGKFANANQSLDTMLVSMRDMNA